MRMSGRTWIRELSVSGLVVLAMAVSVSAYTSHGSIASDETWGASEDTVKLNGDVNVANGATLTILPGTVIRGYNTNYTSEAAWNVNISGTGAIHAAGTSADTIDFKRVRVEFQGLTRDDANRLAWCKFASGWGHALVEFRNMSTPTTEDELSHVTIKNCAFVSSGYCQVYITSGASPTFDSCYFVGSNTGIFSHGSDTLSVRNCRFDDMGCAIVCGAMGGKFYEPMVCHVDHCTFNNVNNARSVASYLSPCQGMAICSFNEPGELNITNSVFYDIAGSGIRDWNIEDANFSENWAVTNDYNIFYRTGGDPCHLFDMGAHSLEADPLLGAGPVFALQDGSPALNAAGDGTNMGAWQPGPVNRDPVFLSVAANTAFEDAAYAYTAVATDADSAETLHTYALVTAPAGMSIDTATGTVSWTPDNGDVGAHTVAVQAVDDSGRTATQRYTLTVVNTNDPPRITSVPDTAVNEGTAYAYTVTVADDDAGDTVVYALKTAPTGLSIDARGLVAWTPGGVDTGISTVVLTVSDRAGAADTQRFVIHVTDVNQVPEAPVILQPASTAHLSADDTVRWTCSDGDPGDTLTYQLEISDNSGFTSLKVLVYDLADTLVVLGNLLQIGNLEHNMIYYIRVVASDRDDAQSAYSTSKTFIFDAGTVIHTATGRLDRRGRLPERAYSLYGRAAYDDACGIRIISDGIKVWKRLELND